MGLPYSSGISIMSFFEYIYIYIYKYIYMEKWDKTSNKNLPGSTGSNKWIQNDWNKYMVKLNHQQFKNNINWALSAFAFFRVYKVKKKKFNISTGKACESRKYKIIMKMFHNLLFKFTLNDQENWKMVV